eukprot:g7721.t1
MPLNLKISWGSGASSARLLGLDDETTLAALKGVIASKSGIAVERIQLKAGFPPKNVAGSEGDPVVSLGVTTGSALTVLELKAAPPAPTPSPPPPAPAPTPAPAAAPTSSSSINPAPPAPPQLQQQQQQQQQHRLDPGLTQSLVEMGFPRESAEGALAAAGGDFDTALEMCMFGDLSLFMTGAGSAAAAAASSLSAAPTSAAAVPKMVRRIIDADNSCLFNAVGYVLRRKRKVGAELRRMITEAVREKPMEYNEGILGKQPEEYCRWISDPKSWGGEIELSILSQKLVVMITVVDIQTNNAYSYGEENRFDRRVFIIYDGIHYDALAEAASDSAPEADDVTVFNPAAREKEALAKAVAADLKARNQFTDMGNASLKCMVCFKLLAGEKGALEHARATKHQNFGQI